MTHPNTGTKEASAQCDTRSSLTDLEMHGDFVRRHIGPSPEEISLMLNVLGLNSLDDLIEKAVPPSIRMQENLNLPHAKSEREAITHLRAMRSRNNIFVSMIGMGYHGTVMPSVIKRNVLENPGWYTAYTPYQAEVSQGRLEALLNFQQMIIDLTGMDLANASLLDEATSAAEAMMMLDRVKTTSCNKYFVSHDCHPQTIAVIQTRAQSLGIELVIGDPHKELTEQECFGIFLQYPVFYQLSKNRQ